MTLNPHDLADLLSLQGFLVDYDTGEIDYPDDMDISLLITLAASGKLDVGRDLSFVIPDLTIVDMDTYCEYYPNDPQCKCYDV
jgi:hypothetical protein